MSNSSDESDGCNHDWSYISVQEIGYQYVLPSQVVSSHIQDQHKFCVSEGGEVRVFNYFRELGSRVCRLNDVLV